MGWHHQGELAYGIGRTCKVGGRGGDTAGVHWAGGLEKHSAASRGLSLTTVQAPRDGRLSVWLSVLSLPAYSRGSVVAVRARA